MTYGTWATDTTGGDIDTGLGMCEQIFLQPNSNVSPAVQCNIAETLPVAGSAVTIAVTSGVDGYWMALGDRHI